MPVRLAVLVVLAVVIVVFVGAWSPSQILSWWSYLIYVRAILPSFYVAVSTTKASVYVYV